MQFESIRLGGVYCVGWQHVGRRNVHIHAHSLTAEGMNERQRRNVVEICELVPPVMCTCACTVGCGNVSAIWIAYNHWAQSRWSERRTSTRNANVRINYRHGFGMSTVSVCVCICVVSECSYAAMRTCERAHAVKPSAPMTIDGTEEELSYVSTYGSHVIRVIQQNRIPLRIGEWG